MPHYLCNDVKRRAAVVVCLALIAGPILASAQDATPTPTPTPTGVAPPQAPPGEDGWTCGSSICCQTTPTWLYDWFMRSLPDGDSCQLQLELWGYVLIAAVAFLLFSTCCMSCYFTRNLRCWDPCRPCCLPFCQPSDQVVPYAHSHADRTVPIVTGGGPRTSLDRFTSIAPPTTGWPTVVPDSVYKAVETGDLPLVPDYHPMNHGDNSHIYDFKSWVSSLAPDTANAVYRHHILAHRSQEAQMNGHTRHMAYMIGQRFLPDMVEVYDPDGSRLFHTAPPPMLMGDTGHTVMSIEGGGGTQMTTVGPATQAFETAAGAQAPGAATAASATHKSTWYNPFTWGKKGATPAVPGVTQDVEAAGEPDNQDQGGSIGALHQNTRKKPTQSPTKQPEADSGAQPPAVEGSEQQPEGGRLSYPPPASPKKKGLFGFGKTKDTPPQAEGAAADTSTDATPTKKSWLSWASPTKQSEGQQSAETSPAKRGWFGRTKAPETAGTPAAAALAAADAAQQPPEAGQQQQQQQGEETRDTEQAHQQPLPASHPPPGPGAPGTEGEEQEPDGATGADGAQPAARKAGLLGGLFGKKAPAPDKAAAAEPEEQGAPPPKGSPMKKLFGLGSAPPKDLKDATAEGSSGRGMFGFMRGKKPEDASVAGEGDAGATEPPAPEDEQPGAAGQDPRNTGGPPSRSSGQRSSLADEPEPEQATVFDTAGGHWEPPPVNPAPAEEEESMGADRAGQAPHDEPAPEEPQSPVSQDPRPLELAKEPLPPSSGPMSLAPLGPPAGGLEPLKPAGGLAPLKPAGGLEPLRPPGGGLKPLAPLDGPQPVHESVEEIEDEELPPEGMGITGGLLPRTLSSRYSNMEGTVTDMQTAAAMAEAARAAADEEPVSAVHASTASSGAVVRSIDTEDGF